MNQFERFNLKENTLKAISNIHFEKPTQIQEIVLPYALDNKNFACKGKTGSGKTHCFLIPLFNKIDFNNKKLQAIILLPTRELAMQTFLTCKEFFKDCDIKISVLTGGIDTEREISKINETPLILIGTPEKICEVAIENGLLNLSSVETFIIDEADMTLEMGFLNEVDKIASLCKNAQFMLFSATIPAGIRQFIKKYFKMPLILQDYKDNQNDQIEHILYPIKGNDKTDVLLHIINHIQPYVCLIFSNTKENVERIYSFLQNANINCGIIHGDLSSRERKSNIKRALDGKYQYIVCSDIAARGIDIDGVSHVISYDIPKNNLEFYTHRAGRAGRNSLTGQCITLYTKEDYEAIKKLESQGINFTFKQIKNDIWVEEKVFDSRNKRKKSAANDELQQKINKAVRMNKSKKVKPNYKKKVKKAIDDVKRKYRREIIQNDINKRIKQRAIKRSRGESND